MKKLKFTFTYIINWEHHKLFSSPTYNLLPFYLLTNKGPRLSNYIDNGTILDLPYKIKWCPSCTVAQNYKISPLRIKIMELNGVPATCPNGRKEFWRRKVLKSDSQKTNGPRVRALRRRRSCGPYPCKVETILQSTCLCPLARSRSQSY